MQLSNDSGAEPSKEIFFIKTRKRKGGRECKSPTAVINVRLSTIKDRCSSDVNSESADQFVSGNSSYWNSWLVGRRALPKRLNTNTSNGNSSQVSINVEN